MIGSDHLMIVASGGIMPCWLSSEQVAPAHDLCNTSLHAEHTPSVSIFVQRCSVPVYLCTLLLQHFSICTQMRTLHETELRVQQLKQQVHQLVSQGRLEAAEPTHALAADVIMRTGVCWALCRWQRNRSSQHHFGDAYWEFA
jgi:hypothetical protein